ncbi:ferredoxin-type protein NapF [Phyllobacterium brassicacearum]|uniref:Ferredoxin-type protein NapF n=1 Tax=Phyllobacterium brassicacearum TaxID=314235 RepID=A0A2P7B6E0_9HYPH|nr:ferredoxin-type protein NapF [Phyllobacterium brassicacearum]PSH62009.1 ferredoxin-type protein NapF [Phyllobacterium brassicacearum]TDQ14911.1 ferredoxin-type protein NapF [Phyllobacterium brassicacearum]
MTATNISRRAFLVGRQAPGFRRILPPGTTAESLLACSGCGNCADACPTHIICLVGDLPTLDFSHGECTFCGECANVCPEQVFQANLLHRFPHVALITDSCLARNHVECQSCRDACPEQAIRFRPQIRGPFLPVLDDEVCNGCGACISVCPVAAINVRELSHEAAHA